MSNPTAVMPTGSVDGIWFLPFNNREGIETTRRAWVGAATPASSRQRSSEVLRAPTRQASITELGVLHLEDGAVEDGLLFERHNLTGDQWLKRLEWLIEHQQRYDRVLLVTPRRTANVELVVEGGLDKRPVIAGGQAWRVSFSFRELEWNRITRGV